jgi:hypothetical protein
VPAPVYVEFAKDVEAAQDEIESAAIQIWRKAIDGGEKRRKSQKKMVPVPDGSSPTGYSYIVIEETTTEETTFSDWRAARAWLEHNLPEFYAPPHKRKPSGKNGKSIGVIMLPAMRGTADEHGMATADRKVKAG